MYKVGNCEALRVCWARKFLRTLYASAIVLALPNAAVKAFQGDDGGEAFRFEFDNYVEKAWKGHGDYWFISACKVNQSDIVRYGNHLYYFLMINDMQGQVIAVGTKWQVRQLGFIETSDMEINNGWYQQALGGEWSVNYFGNVFKQLINGPFQLKYKSDIHSIYRNLDFPDCRSDFLVFEGLAGPP